MKALLLLCLLAGAAGAQILPGRYSGGIISTRCPVPVGGQLLLDVIPGVQVRLRLIDNDQTTLDTIAALDSRGRFHLRQFDGTTMTGRLRYNSRYVYFRGTGRDPNCRYKFQGRYRHS